MRTEVLQKSNTKTFIECQNNHSPYLPGELLFHQALGDIIPLVILEVITASSELQRASCSACSPRVDVSSQV